MAKFYTFFTYGQLQICGLVYTFLMLHYDQKNNRNKACVTLFLSTGDANAIWCSWGGSFHQTDLPVWIQMGRMEEEMFQKKLTFVEIFF